MAIRAMRVTHAKVEVFCVHVWKSPDNKNSAVLCIPTHASEESGYINEVYAELKRGGHPDADSGKPMVMLDPKCPADLRLIVEAAVLKQP